MGAVIGAGAIVAALVMMGGSSEPIEPSPSPIATSDGCNGVEGQSIGLDAQVVEPEPRTCFVLDEAASVTIGAAALEPSDLIELALHDADGTEISVSRSDVDWDPEVTLDLEPGTYTITVTGPDGSDTPPFLLYTATFAPGTGAPDLGATGPDTASVPSAEECGREVPLLTGGSPVSIDADQGVDAAADAGAPDQVHFACIEVNGPVFAKVGLESEDPSDELAPDLTMAIYRAGTGDQEATLLRVADDAIGFDPETSLELEPGTYMIAASAWLGGPTGAFDFYYDDDGSVFRRGAATSMHADVSEQVCERSPTVLPGDTLTVDGERTYVCLEVEEQQRLTIQAATLTDQDLVLEVLGFDDGPYRLAWADGNPYSDALADFDPLLDQTVPAGTWIVAVTTYFTGTAADYDLRVVAGGGE